MAKPTVKSPFIESALIALGGDRHDAVRTSRCVSAPAGCGEMAVEFRDQRSAAEYAISGLCQECQDCLFGIGDCPLCSEAIVKIRGSNIAACTVCAYREITPAHREITR